MKYLRLMTIALASVLFMSKAQAVVINSYTAFYKDGSSLYIDFRGNDFDFGYHYLPAIDSDEAGISEAFPAVLTHPRFTLPIGGFDPFYNGFAFWVDVSGRATMTQFSYIGVAPEVVATNAGWAASSGFSDWLLDGASGQYFSPFVRGRFSYGDAPVQVPEPPMTIILILSLLAVVGSAHRMRAAATFY